MEKSDERVPPVNLYSVLRRASATCTEPHRIQNVSIVWRGASQAEEAHSSADEQIKLYVVYRPDHAQTTQP